MKAIIFGITGQDGYYLTELLLEKEYEVLGVARRASTNNRGRLRRYKDERKLKIIEGDITDCNSVHNIIQNYRVDEIYNLAAQSHVFTSFNQPLCTFENNTTGCLNILESIRSLQPSVKFYQASSSEMFGKSYSVRGGRSLVKFQDENTPMMPQSPYAVSKLAAHHLVRIYRDSYSIFACSGILHNHESPMRGENFVTRKITKWIGEFKAWCDDQCCFQKGGGEPIQMDYSSDRIFVCVKDKIGFPKLQLGNLEVSRDWGHAKDYVRAMHAMLQYYRPDDYVVSTQETHSISDFLKEAFSYIGIDKPLDYIKINSEFYRPSEVSYLLGDSSKARFVLKWKPTYNFSSLVREMVEVDIERAQKKKRQRAKEHSS